MPHPSDSQKSQFSSNPNATPVKTVSVPVEQTTIGRSLVIKGEVSGTESLYAESRVPLILPVTASPLGVTVAPPPTSVPAKL